MGLIKILKNPYFILITVIILFLISCNTVIRSLDKAFNESAGKTPHTAIMLWKSPGYSSEPQLYFFRTEIYPNPDKIIVNYKIENKSDKAMTIGNLIDVGVVKADANTIGDPGTLIWRWSQKHNEIRVEKIEISQRGIYQKEIEIDRKEIDIQFQYYINAYYNGEVVAQYKIIEGIYDK